MAFYHLEYSKGQKSIPNQLGRPCTKPTFSWATYLMRRVKTVKFLSHGTVRDYIDGIKETQKTIIEAFGPIALEIYGFS